MMKKIVFTMAVLIISSALLSQNSKVQTASNYLRVEKIDKALEAIEPATTHPKTMNKAKTWFIRGNILLNLHFSDDEALIAKEPNALNKAFESYQKAKELDIKKEYEKHLFINYMSISGEFYNKGVEKYKRSEWLSAMNFFDKSFIIKKDINIIDTAALFYSAVMAKAAKKDDIAKDKFVSLVDMNYNKPELYSHLSVLYLSDKKFSEAKEILIKGRELYPDNIDIMLTEANIYLTTEDTEKSREILEQVISKDINNPSVFFALGTNYDAMFLKEEDLALKKTYFDKAIESYNKALELKPDYYEPLYNLGAINVNRAAKLQSEANSLPMSETKRYDELKNKVDLTLLTALPFLEMANKIKPNDIDALNSLKEIYARLKMLEKAKDINIRIKELMQE